MSSLRLRLHLRIHGCTNLNKVEDELSYEYLVGSLVGNLKDYGSLNKFLMD
jgi:hypothetical protein